MHDAAAGYEDGKLESRPPERDASSTDGRPGWRRFDGGEGEDELRGCERARERGRKKKRRHREREDQNEHHPASPRKVR